MKTLKVTSTLVTLLFLTAGHAEMITRNRSVLDILWSAGPEIELPKVRMTLEQDIHLVSIPLPLAPVKGETYNFHCIGYNMDRNEVFDVSCEEDWEKNNCFLVFQGSFKDSTIPAGTVLDGEIPYKTRIEFDPQNVAVDPEGHVTPVIRISCNRDKKLSKKEIESLFSGIVKLEYLQGTRIAK